MKKTLLFIILVLSLGVVKAQTWKVLGNNNELSTKKITNADISIDKSTNDVYIVFPENELNDSSSLYFKKYTSNGGWQDLPPLMNLLKTNMSIINNRLIEPQIYYINNALYLTYRYEPNLDKVKIKKLKNNLWTNVGDDINGYDIIYHRNCNKIIYNNSIYLFSNNLLFEINDQDQVIQHNIPFNTFFSTGKMAVQNGKVYILGTKIYSSGSNIEIASFNFDDLTTEIIYSSNNSNFSAMEFDNVDILSSSNKLILLVTRKELGTTGTATTFFHWEVNNNQIVFQKDTMISDAYFEGRNPIIAGNNILVSYRYEEVKFLLYNGLSWSDYGNNTDFSKLIVTYSMDLNNTGAPFVVGSNFSSQKAAVIYLENPVSISEPVVSSFSVFPNPSNGVFNIHTKENAENISYQVYALDGKKIVEKTNASAPFSVDISNESNGVYVLKVNQNEKSETFKLLKLNE